MRYNQKRDLELRKCSQNFKNIGKSIYKEKDFLELCRYEGAIQEHIYWKNRRQFALLMESFFNGTIDGEEFRRMGQSYKIPNLLFHCLPKVELFTWKKLFITEIYLKIRQSLRWVRLMH